MSLFNLVVLLKEMESRKHNRSTLRKYSTRGLKLCFRKMFRTTQMFKKLELFCNLINLKNENKI